MSAPRPTQDVRVTDRGHPSRIVLLHHLKKLETGTKVRFLGCIESFNVGSSTALFSHQLSGNGKTSTVKVDLEAVLGTPQLVLEVGSWLNVVGYVVDVPGSTKKGVQAVLAWSPGEVDLRDYEETIRAMTRQ